MNISKRNVGPRHKSVTTIASRFIHLSFILRDSRSRNTQKRKNGTLQRCSFKMASSKPQNAHTVENISACSQRFMSLERKIQFKWWYMKYVYFWDLYKINENEGWHEKWFGRGNILEDNKHYCGSFKVKIISRPPNERRLVVIDADQNFGSCCVIIQSLGMTLKFLNGYKLYLWKFSILTGTCWLMSRRSYFVEFVESFDML